MYYINFYTNMSNEAVKLKRGQRPEGWKNNCPKFKEYYAIQHPDWTEDECVAAAKKFCRSINWQCIEFYQVKYPNATPEEHERMRKEAIENKKDNSPAYLQYYINNFPEKTLEECKEMLRKYTTENCFQSLAYYQKHYPNATSEEHERMLKDAKKSYLVKRPSTTGENNPNHKSNTSNFKRRSRSPKCIEFYQVKYPNATPEEHERMLKEHFKNVEKIMQDKTKQVKCIEYWLAKGYNEEEAKQLISKSQKTFSLEKCIEKYGLEEGVKRFEKRQDKWIKSLRKNFSKYGDGRSNSSEFAYDIISCICKRICINRPSKEKYMTDKDGNHYAYDFCHNKKIIEFNGDYWHMNPNIYKANDINKTKKLTAQEVWDFDKRKMKCAEEHGYKVLYIWESEYNESRSAVIKKCMEFLTS